jgi:hypothetical protein
MSHQLSEFHRALGDLVESCARLDFVACLQLACWSEIEPRSVPSLLKKNVSFNDRLKKLRALCDVYAEGVREKERRGMDRWFSELHRVREFRNEYSHGRWITPPVDGPAGLQIQFVSLEQALAQSTDILMVKLVDLVSLANTAKRLIGECHSVLSPFLERALAEKLARDSVGGARRAEASKGGLSG